MEFFQRYPIWSDVSMHLKKKVYRAEDVLVHRGDNADYLWVVMEGWIKLTRQTPDGKETVVDLCTQNDVFGEAALSSEKLIYPYTAQVLSKRATVAKIGHSILQDAIQNNQRFSHFVFSLMIEKKARADVKIEQMSTLSATQRLGCFLLRLCRSNAQESVVLQIPVEKNILATYLGMKAETFSRSQVQLKPYGITVVGNEVHVENVARLREFVCNSCAEFGSCDT